MKYKGNKGSNGVPQWIINQLPPHTEFVELFGGSAQISRIKPLVKKSTIVEVDPVTIAEHLHDVNSGIVVVNDCAISWLRSNAHLLSSSTLIYADPPYVLSARRSGREYYTHEMTDQQHVDLLQLLLSTPSAVVISGYPSAIYDEYLVGWRKSEFTVSTRKGPAIECLWMNFPAPDHLFTYEHLGVNRTDRQRIKRKIERWAEGLNRLPSLERQAILARLMP